MTSNTFNFNATVCFSFNMTVTPVTRGSPSGGPSAANIHLDGQFQFSANIRILPNPLVSNPSLLSVSPSRTTDLTLLCAILHILSHFPVVSISPVFPVSPVSPISPVVPAVVPAVPAVPVVPVVPAVVPTVPTASISPILPFPSVLGAISAQNCAHRAILPAAMLAPVDTTPVTPTTASTPVTPDIPATPATTTTPYTASIVTANPVTPVAEPSWLKKAMRNDRPFWESPKRSSKRVIPPVRARVHPDSVPEDWVTTYIDNEPRTFYYPMKQY
ncbi:hypothetical protein BASA50_008692 [Batrachochytrium salamandrivorans]|uniref:Uncharacterized protein n=1 Tax=Batrachochytrium salamandrivorans TaxID=1357716 RepID=A0ABQ8F426_9FUNG|nr:hypothetical protein BASA50_008692 [Batrachochytrium salamandrivorans]